MKLTNSDKSIIDTDTLDDATSLLLEKLAELKDLCALYQVPMFAVLNTRIQGELRPSTCFSVTHPSESPILSSQNLLQSIVRWWNGVLPRQRLILEVKEEMA